MAALIAAGASAIDLAAPGAVPACGRLECEDFEGKKDTPIGPRFHGLLWGPSEMLPDIRHGSPHGGVLSRSPAALRMCLRLQKKIAQGTPLTRNARSFSELFHW